jgi:WD40 repeat protein
MLRLSAVLLVLSLSVPAFAQKQQLSIASPDGKQTVTAKDKVISVTDNNTQKVILSISAHTSDITGLGYAPDGKMIGSVDKDGSLKLFDSSSGKEVRSIKAGISGSLSFSPDGKALAIKSDKDTKKFDLATGKELQ